MKRFAAIALILLSLTVPVLAGETGMPPCKVNCPEPTSSTSTTVSSLVLELVLALIKK